MKLVIGFVISYLCFVEIIDSRMMRLQPNDEIYPYTIDPSISPYTEYVSTDDFLLEQIDDDNVHIGGHLVFKKSYEPKKPVQFEVKTKHFQYAVWQDAYLTLTLPSMCPEFVNPNRFWYNITKLWTACPAQNGDKWPIESQTIDVRMNVPPTVPSGSWQAFVLAYQLGTDCKLGFMFQVEVKTIA